jgi:group I intron endonuclease
MGKSGIYKITNPKNKVYIGQSKDIIKRWYYYKTLHCKSQIKLYNSLLKYGVENHVFEIIEECSAGLLNEREIYWGLQLNSLSNENLNLKLGERNYIISDETRKKRSELMKKRLSNKENHPMFGKKNPNAKKRMLSDKNPMKGKHGKLHHNFGKQFSPNIKKSMQIDKILKNNGFKNIKEAIEFKKVVLELYQQGEKQKEISKILNKNQSTISRIVKNKIWTEI